MTSARSKAIPKPQRAMDPLVQHHDLGHRRVGNSRDQNSGIPATVDTDTFGIISPGRVRYVAGSASLTAGGATGARGLGEGNEREVCEGQTSPDACSESRSRQRSTPASESPARASTFYDEGPLSCPHPDGVILLTTSRCGE